MTKIYLLMEDFEKSGINEPLEIFKTLKSTLAMKKRLESKYSDMCKYTIYEMELRR